MGVNEVIHADPGIYKGRDASFEERWRMSIDVTASEIGKSHTDWRMATRLPVIFGHSLDTFTAGFLAGHRAARHTSAVTVLELADSFKQSGKTLFYPEEFPPGYPQGWKDAHAFCADDLRDFSRKIKPTPNDEATDEPRPSPSIPNDE